jgi:hypothetical protein
MAKTIEREKKRKRERERSGKIIDLIVIKSTNTFVFWHLIQAHLIQVKQKRKVGLGKICVLPAFKQHFYSLETIL